ncbi:hypothetical protein ARMGADRAFT_1080932 [Armillaria gallica]|uniref:HMG box domain-containing protein n=1 Tax=Armillaria gallica TaxID=47427 RepID=A0A2H3DA81_ARMGA|nr:hypothetical protein ARMGADRAFT_1080932 [Armillaria gallica]
MLCENKDTIRERDHREISRIRGELWRSLPPAEKRIYTAKAISTKEDHLVGSILTTNSRRNRTALHPILRLFIATLPWLRLRLPDLRHLSLRSYQRDLAFRKDRAWGCPDNVGFVLFSLTIVRSSAIVNLRGASGILRLCPRILGRFC